MILLMVAYATGYSELAFARSRKITQLLKLAQNRWILRIGCPTEFFAEQELDKDMIKHWAAKNGIAWAGYLSPT